MQPIRIQKALSEAGVASRRRAEELVREGRVTVNGRRAEIGQSVNPDRDVVAVDGRRVYFARKKQYRYLMMNKPRGYVTTLSDELGRRCVTDLLAGVEERVYPIGRLDRNSEGLLLFTNDGELAHRLLSPRHGVWKRYYAEHDGQTDERDVEAFARGLTLADGLQCMPARLTPLGAGRSVVQVQEGKYHQVRRMLASVGKPVRYLRREAEGGLELGTLPLGQWVELPLPQTEQLLLQSL